MKLVTRKTVCVSVIAHWPVIYEYVNHNVSEIIKQNQHKIFFLMFNIIPDKEKNIAI